MLSKVLSNGDTAANRSSPFPYKVYIQAEKQKHINTSHNVR